MVMIANLQCDWTLSVNPIDQRFHLGRVAIQVAFTIFTISETWLAQGGNCTPRASPPSFGGLLPDGHHVGM
jgi:hypothetical protein